MVKLAKALTGVAIAALLFFLYLQAGARLRAEVTEVSVASATERRDAFDTLSAAVMRGDVDTAYTQIISDDPSQYCFVTYTVSARNIGLPAAEWAQLGVQRAEGDVALIPGDAQDIGAFSEGTLSAVLLTTKDAAYQQRAVWADYYVLGRKFSAAASGAQ